MDLYPFKAGQIEPIVLPGQIVGLWVTKNFRFAEVVFIEGIPRSDPVTLDLGVVAAGATSAITLLANLDLPDREFGQFRAFVVDDFQALFFQARADNRYKLENVNATITRATTLRDPCGHLTEFYVYQDEHAYMQALNPTGYALTQTRVAFYGFRYVIEPRVEYTVNKPPAVWTRVPATAHL